MLNLLSHNEIVELVMAGVGIIAVISALWAIVVGIITKNPSNKWAFVVPLVLFTAWMAFIAAVRTYEYDFINYIAEELYWVLVVVGW